MEEIQPSALSELVKNAPMDEVLAHIRFAARIADSEQERVFMAGMEIILQAAFDRGVAAGYRHAFGHQYGEPLQ